MSLLISWDIHRLANTLLTTWWQKKLKMCKNPWIFEWSLNDRFLYGLLWLVWHKHPSVLLPGHQSAYQWRSIHRCNESLTCRGRSVSDAFQNHPSYKVQTMFLDKLYSHQVIKEHWMKFVAHVVLVSLKMPGTVLAFGCVESALVMKNVHLMHELSIFIHKIIFVSH